MPSKSPFLGNRCFIFTRQNVRPRQSDYGFESAPLVSLTKRLASRTAKPTSTSARTANILRCHKFNGVPPSFKVAWSEIEMLIPSTKPHAVEPQSTLNEDRKSTRLNSSHVSISYAVFS